MPPRPRAGRRRRVGNHRKERSTSPRTEVPPGYGTWDPWLEMQRMQERIDGLFADSWARMHADMAGLPPTVQRAFRG